MCTPAKSIQLCLFVTSWTVAHQAPLSIGFSRQGYWSGLPFPSPGDLPVPETEPTCTTLQADHWTTGENAGSWTAKRDKKLISWRFLSHHETDQNLVELLYTHFPVWHGFYVLITLRGVGEVKPQSFWVPWGSGEVEAFGASEGWEQEDAFRPTISKEGVCWGCRE